MRGIFTITCPPLQNTHSYATGYTLLLKPLILMCSCAIGVNSCSIRTLGYELVMIQQE